MAKSSANKEQSLQALVDTAAKIAVDHEFIRCNKNEAMLWVVTKFDDGLAIVCETYTWYPKENCWIEDSISEMEGPVSLACPLRFFSLVPKADFPEWREEVRKYHEGSGPSYQTDRVAIKLAMAVGEKAEKNKKNSTEKP